MNKVSKWYNDHRIHRELSTLKGLPVSAELYGGEVNSYTLVIENHKVVKNLRWGYAKSMMEHTIRYLKETPNYLMFIDHLKYSNISSEGFVTIIVDELKNDTENTMYYMAKIYESWAAPWSSTDGIAFFKSKECKQLAYEIAGWFEESKDMRQTCEMFEEHGRLYECVTGRMASLFEEFRFDNCGN